MKDITALLFALLIGTGGPAESSIPTGAEMGGRIIGHPAAQREHLASVHAYADGKCVATALSRLDGTYSLNLPPGRYWIQLKIGKNEVAAEPVDVPPGSVQRDFQVPPAAFVALPTAQLSQVQATQAAQTPPTRG